MNKKNFSLTIASNSSAKLFGSLTRAQFEIEFDHNKAKCTLLIIKLTHHCPRHVRSNESRFSKTFLSPSKLSALF